MVESIGALAAVIVPIWIGRQKPGWRLMTAALFFGVLALYQLRSGFQSPQALVLPAILAAAFGGVLLPRAWGNVSVGLVAVFTVAPAVAEAIGMNLPGLPLAPGPGIPALAASSLAGLGLIALEARSRSSILRAIEHERDLCRRLRDGTANGIVMLDRDCRVLEWNPAMERLTGIPRRQAEGMILTDCPGFGAGTSHEGCLRLAGQGVEIATEEGDSPLRGYYSPVRSASGEVTGVFALVTHAA